MESVVNAKLLLILRWSSSFRRGRQNISLAYVVGACVGDAFFCLRNKAFSHLPVSKTRTMQRTSSRSRHGMLPFSERFGAFLHCGIAMPMKSKILLSLRMYFSLIIGAFIPYRNVDQKSIDGSFHLFSLFHSLFTRILVRTSIPVSSS